MKYFMGWLAIGLSSVVFLVSPPVGSSRPSAASPPASSTVLRSTTVQARVMANGDRLEVRSRGRTQRINARDLNVRILDAIDCSRVEVVPEQQLSAARFVGAPAIDLETGNVAIAARLQECVGTQTSAVFVIQPQTSGYAVYRVQVPGARALPDEFSTYPLNSITRVSYLDGDLLVRHGDASGSIGMLVFTPATTPAGQYAGCVLVRREEGDRLCPRTP